jgi:hypothetical protein
MFGWSDGSVGLATAAFSQVNYEGVWKVPSNASDHPSSSINPARSHMKTAKKLTQRLFIGSWMGPSNIQQQSI